MDMTLNNRPLRRGDYRVVAVSSMEQIIGTTLTAIEGIMIPLIHLVGHPELSPVMQGVIGAAGLVGISVGSAVIGDLMDRQGYLLWFRLCPVIIIAGSLVVLCIESLPFMVLGLFIIGVGVGGGYSLDSAYISEIVPAKWKQFMVGVAKATCSLGFVVAALVSWILLLIYPYPQIWNKLILIIASLGVLSLLLRLRWDESPLWYRSHGETAKAQKAIDFFLGKGISPDPAPAKPSAPPAKWSDMFRGKNLNKVIFSGVPWACEGLGVYGFGVFLPVLLMALGISDGSGEGIAKVIGSVKMTLWINLTMVPGFIIGLLLVRRRNRARMMSNGFIGSAVGLLLLFAAYMLKWPVWVSVVGFMVFEIALNAGPHLVTFIIPTQIYDVNERGAGSGIAAMVGKIGAILGVFVMPLLLKHGGMTAVLLVSVGVMLLGTLITLIYGRILKLL